MKTIGTPIDNTVKDYKKQLFIDDLLRHGWVRTGGANYEERNKKCGGWFVKYDYHGHFPIWFKHPDLEGTVLMFEPCGFHVTTNGERFSCYGYEAYNEIFRDVFPPIDHIVSDPFYN